MKYLTSTCPNCWDNQNQGKSGEIVIVKRSQKHMMTKFNMVFWMGLWD